MGVRERGEGQQIGGGLAEHLFDLGELPAEHPGDLVELGGDLAGGGLDEDRADGGGDHLRRSLGDAGQHVAGEVDPAALPGGAEEHRGDRRLEALVGVGDHEAHTGEAPDPQAAQERPPEGPVLGIADGQAEDFPVPDPGNAFGIFNVTSPALVDNTRERLPLRCVARSSLRS